jgi:hypothetical protein
MKWEPPDKEMELTKPGEDEAWQLIPGVRRIVDE